jgi:Ca2+-binding RTX toxin-like protein
MGMKHQPDQLRVCVEPLEPRQLMALLAGISINPNLQLKSDAFQIGGTANNDFIRVNSVITPQGQRQLTIEVNPSAAKPPQVVLLDPNRRVQINGGNGHDTIVYSGNESIRILGGAGNDRITGGNGADVLLGGPGFDTLDGGRGGDALHGGSEADTVTYESRTADLVVGTDGLAGDGEAGENDNIQNDVETIIGGSGNDNLSFAAIPVIPNNFGPFVVVSGTNRKLVGGAGNDTLFGSKGPDIIEGGLGNDGLIGNAGDDFLTGEAGNDIINGDAGNDVLSGGANNDLMFGGAGRDTMFGDDGSDTMRGGTRGDVLNGGANDDVLHGELSNDILRGDGGNDRLYGGDNRDTLNGGAGFDGLFGGVDASPDDLTGGSENDRFLMFGSDILRDKIALEPRVFFQNGAKTTTKFAGQDGSYTFDAGSWTDSEVEGVDTALHVLHQTSRNMRLIKTFNRGELKFIRQGKLLSSTGGTFDASASNRGGAITVYTTTSIVASILHEVGHNFDEEFDGAGWRSLSGWTQADKSNDPRYVRGLGNDGWFYLKSAEFVSIDGDDYARTNPVEDFAEHFQAFMLMRVQGPIPMPVAKFEFINSMVNRLAITA